MRGMKVAIRNLIFNRTMPDTNQSLRPLSHLSNEARGIPKQPLAFCIRIDDAKVMLSSGCSEQEVKEKHGAVILREAKDALFRSFIRQMPNHTSRDRIY
jgi:hypothetical protein